MTLRRRLLLTFAGLGVVPIVVIGALAALQLRWLAETGGREALRGHLETLSQLIRREVELERINLRTLVGDWRYPTRGESTAGADLASWLALHPDLLSRVSQKPPMTIRYLVLDGDTRGWTGVEARLSPYRPELRALEIRAEALPAAYRELASRAERGTAAEGDGGDGGRTLPGTITTLYPLGPALGIVVPLGPAGRVAPPRGDVPLVIEETSVLGLLDHLLSQPAFQELETSFAAANPAGAWHFIHHSDPTLMGRPIGETDWPPPARRLLDPAPDPGWSFARSGDRLYAAGIEPTSGWLIGQSLSLAPRLAPLRDTLRFSLLLLLLMSGLVTLGILLVTRGIGQAVEEIADSAEAISRGELQRSIRVNRSDEFGAIAGHVNQMARDLLVTAEAGSIARVSARLAHDLKGVASQMSLLVYNLRENYDDPEFRAEFQDLMRGLIDQVESLVLQLGRGAAEAPSDLRPVDLDALVRRILETRIRAGWPGLVVEEDLHSPGAVMAREELLGEALENVMVNAAEAMAGRGRLTVRTGSVEDAARRPGGRAGAQETRGTAGPPRPTAAAGGLRPMEAPTHFVEMQDTGPGMSREFIEDGLFRPFVTTKARGLGLGMYQVRRAITGMGGRIEVSSGGEGGARVRIELGRREMQERRGTG